MMSFLRSYKPLLNIYLALGICPFQVNLTKNVVECGIISLLYSVLLYILLAIGLLHFWVASFFHNNVLDACGTGTCNYALIIQSLIIFVLFITSSLDTIINRLAHLQLLNEIVNMETIVLKHFGIEMFPKEMVLRICIRNSLFVLCYFGLNISAIYGLELNENADLTIYHYLFGCEILIITLTNVHVIAICSVLKHCSEMLLTTVKKLYLLRCDDDPIAALKHCNDHSSIKVYQIFQFLDRINEFKIKMCSVFGMRLLINQSMDFILLTVAVYYFILVNIPQQFRFNWTQVYFTCAYVVPVIFKNFALVVATDTLGCQTKFRATNFIMNFLVQLNRILLILLLFGVCPMSLNKAKTEVVTTYFELLYICIYTVAVTVALGFFGYYAYFIHGIDRIIQDTASISGYSQTIFVILIFYATIIVALCNKKAQSKYFNRVQAFDEKLNGKLKLAIENGNILSWMVYQHLFVIVAELCFYIIGQLLEGFDVYTFTFHVFLGFMILTITLAALHVRNCGIILSKRFTILYNKLDHITDSPSLTNAECDELLNIFDFVEDLFLLKHKFGKAFGFQLLLNSAFDFIYLTIAIYYVLMSLVSAGFQWKEVYKFMAFSLTHIVKNVMIVFVMENLAGQVDEIRKIATKASMATNQDMSASLDLLFLKLQHMEKTKYITANDFFPINYAMLYNMGAAIVTHMMILLQFQQWEDSQKLLSTSENSTAVVAVITQTN